MSELNTCYTVEELAERMETSSRSIYRYIDTFRSAGFTIYKEGAYIRMGKESRKYLICERNAPLFP